MTHRDFLDRLPCVLLKLVRPTFLSIGLALSFYALSSPTQAATTITETTGSGNLGTHVLLPIGNVYGITDGTPVGNNLYHSFSQFNVGTGDIAQFQTPSLIPNAAMHNILGRITDANPSAIFGTIDSATYYPGASLFLMNPHGFLFGPNAMVNVGGMAAFTTADYLRLTDNVRFEAIPGAQDALLSTFPVAAFGFLGPNLAAISVQGSTLSVQTGQSLALVGGKHGFTYKNPDTDATASVPDGMTMTGGTLSAPSGQINVVGVASAGEISAIDFMSTSGMTMGNIALSQGATLDVTGIGGGIIRIRGGQFTMDHAFLISDSTIGSPGPTTAITTTVAGDIILSNGSAISARALGQNQGGAVEITAHNITVADGSIIRTESRNAGRAGDISVTAGGNLLISGSDAFDNSSQIQSNALAGGGGGTLTINAANVTLANRGVIETRALGQGPAGDITLIANRLDVTGGGGVDTYGSDLAPSGSIHLTVADTISLSGQFDEITVSRIENQNVFGDTGNIVIDTNNLTLSNNGRINSSTFASSVPPTDPKISITARDSVTISGGSHIDVSSSLSDVGPVDIHTGALTLSDLSTINTRTDGTGASGPITLAVSSLTMTGGSQITSESVEGFANGGNISIISTGNAILSGQGTDSFGEVKASGIFSRTNGNFDDLSLTGNAGNITLAASSLILSNGAHIDSSSNGFALGNAGQITVTAPTIMMDGGITSTGTQGTGAGGNIFMNANSVAMTNGSSVSASSTGLGNTGNIEINAGNLFAMTDSSVTTEASQASGGAIKITTNPGGTVQLINSLISASVLDGMGGGGSVNIDPQFVILLNSQILAKAFQGPGGNISITTNFLLSDATSVISASSQFGVNGTVTIQSPNAPISGQIQPLGKSPLIATSLFNQRCASLAGGEFSSLTVAGRDSLPTEPGNWLASPLYAGGMGPGVKAEGVKAEGERLEGMSASAGQGARGESLFSSSGLFRASNQRNETNQINQMDQIVLSLRKIAPAGFLTQAFAVEGSASCQS